MTKNSCPKCKKSKNVLEILVSKPLLAVVCMVGINLEKLAWRQNSKKNADCIFYIVIF